VASRKVAQSISKRPKPGSPGFIKTPTDPTKRKPGQMVAGRKPMTRPRPGQGGPKPKPIKKGR
jgi:hypothetical protein